MSSRVVQPSRTPSAGSSPRVHVVVPAYGESPYLTETLSSLVQHLPVECPISVQDDATPGDAVRSQVEPFGPRVDYWRLDRNRGVSGAFNAAADTVQEPYIVLVGPDDRGVPGMLESYLAAERMVPGAAALHPGVHVVDGDGRPASPLVDRIKSVLRPRREGRVSGSRLASSLVAGNWTYNPAIAWRTDFLREHRFDESLHTAMDLDLLLRLVLAGESLALVHSTGLEYRRHAGAVSSVNAGSKRLTEELAVLGRFAEAARRRRWRGVSWLARLAPTARLHGAVLLPRVTTAERRSILRLLASDPLRRVPAR